MKDKVELLFKLENIRKHNKIVQLESKMGKDKEMAKQLCLQYNEIIKRRENEILNLKKELEDLQQKNQILENQKNFYINRFDELPQFIARIFCGKTLNLEEENSCAEKN